MHYPMSVIITHLFNTFDFPFENINTFSFRVNQACFSAQQIADKWKKTLIMVDKPTSLVLLIDTMKSKKGSRPALWPGEFSCTCKTHTKKHPI